MNCTKVSAATAAALLVSSLSATSVAAQSSAAPPVLAVDPRTNGVLPANTEIALAMDDELTTKGGKLKIGQQFGLSVAKDVRVGDYIIIPRGTPAIGEIIFLTGKAAFGKSGKMEVALRYVDLNGRHIPLIGTYRQEGEGNSMATAAGVAAVGVFAGVITGRSAVIPKGRLLTAYLRESLPVAFPAKAAIPAHP